MSRDTLEKRVSELENRMGRLRALITGAGDPKDWRRAIGAFTADPGMQEIWADALRLRAADRARGARKAHRSRSLGGVAGSSAVTLAFHVWAQLDGQDYPCRLQADFVGSE